VFFRGENVRECLRLALMRPGWSFVRELPSSLTRLRLTASGYHLLDGLETLQQCPNLEELDVDVGDGPSFDKSAHSASGEVARALASLPLKRVGLHAALALHCLYLPDLKVPATQRTFDVGHDVYFTTLEEQIDPVSRRSVEKLTLHVHSIPMCPCLSSWSALRELVIGDMWRHFENPCLVPFSLMGLEVVAGTLRHLTVSSSRNLTCVELPAGIHLRSFVCISSGALILHCHPDMLGQGLTDVLLGYASIAGTGARLVQVLSPRLETAVLEVHGLKCLSHQLLFTRATLVGEWWHGVFQVSKQQRSGGCFCCRVRVWVQGCLCPPYLSFLRYGILPTVHEDREVLYGYVDVPVDDEFRAPRPLWHL
jgi:hypothetical protein